MQESDHRGAVLGAAILCLTAVGACDSSPDVVDVDAGGPSADAGADLAPPPKPERRPPLLLEVAPARGLWVDPQAGVTVTGVVEATTGAIAKVKINKTEVATQAGAFSHELPLAPGVNIFGLRVEAEDNERTVDGRAVFRGETHPPLTTIKNAIRVHLGPAFLDDGDPDLDDVSAVTELLLTDPGFADVLKKPFDTDYATMTPTEITLAGASVDVAPVENELSLSLTVHDLYIAFELVGKGGFESFLTGPGTMNAEQVDVILFLQLLSQDDGSLSAEVVYADVTIQGFEVTSEALPTLGETTSLLDLLKEYLEEQVETLVTESIGGLIVDFLQGFAYETSFGEDPKLDVVVSLGSVSVAPHGINLTLDATISSPLAMGIPLSPLTGSLATQTTPMPDNFSAEPVAFLIDDDTINQLLFAYWYGGGLGGIDAKPSDLPTLDFSGLPDAFQPLSRVRMTTLLPPTLGPRTLNDDDFPFELTLGELNLHLDTDTGRQFSLSINARTGVDMEQTENGDVRLRLDTRPKFVELYVGCYAAPLGFDPGNVAALIRLGVPPLLKDLTSQITFELPGLALSSFVELDALAGKVLRFPDLDGGAVGPEGHLLLLEGSPVLADAPEPFP